MKLSNEKGLALFFVLMFFLTASFGLSSLGWMAGSQARIAKHTVENSQSFYMMEAAAEQAKATLNNSFFGTALGESAPMAIGDGEFYYNIEADPNGNAYVRKITGYGAVPNFDDPVSTRTVEVFVQGDGTLEVPDSFDDYVLWSAGNLQFNGNSYTVTGSIITGGAINHQHDRVSGSEIVDPTINPLFQLDFVTLKAIAQSQSYDGHDNHYTAAEVAAAQSMPSTFYYTNPSDASPEGVPHVGYVESDLAIGSDRGGFIIAVGEDTSVAKNVTINGNRAIKGVIYCRGTFTINGGGNAWNVDGGVFAGAVATLNGGITMKHNQTYLDAVEALKTGSGNMTVISWNEIHS